MIASETRSPTQAEIDRIVTLYNAVLRNLQITQCYHELSAVLNPYLGHSANWCTFATWASKQAGQTIRKEDLKRTLENRLKRSPAITQAVNGLALQAQDETEQRITSLQAATLDTGHFINAIDRASDAVARGNKKVFEEIGGEFARFFATCLHDGPQNKGKLDQFCAELRPGDPPDGQGYLRRAFTHYYQALYEQDEKIRAQLILTANLEVGLHEQTRLQPEIAESLDAGLIGSIAFTRKLLAAVFPFGGWVSLAYLVLMRILGRPTTLDRAIQTILAAVRVLLRETITGMMMTLSLPSGEILRLGEDLKSSFPGSLQQITLPELKALIEPYDLSPDSTVGSGTVDWADLPDRLHFIIDFFRSYQEHQELFAPPFAPGQVAAIKAGKLPEGRL